MPSFQWDNRLATHLPQVDEQHRRLVQLIDRFGGLLERPGGVTAPDIDAALREVSDYAIHHFHDEESLMASAGVLPAYIAEHHAEHARFIEEVRLMGAHPAGGDNAKMAEELQAFLTYWLGYHILGADQIMARQVAALQGGASPLQAHAGRQAAHDPATALLLQSVDSLFRLVRERNRALTDLNLTLERRVAQRTQELTDANRRLTEMALTDVLTGLPNRRQAMLHLQSVWEPTTGVTAPLACAMIDADGFKQVNDRHGHDAGDEVLRRLARQLHDAVRTDDGVYRLGGDEFLILLPGTPMAGARMIAEKLCAAARALQVPVGDSIWTGSISVGVAARQPDMDGIDDLLKAADQALYAAKQAGRNRVAAADDA